MMNEIYNYAGDSIPISDYVTPEMFGAKGDGIANDSSAIQIAVNSKHVNFATGKTYKITSPISLKANTLLNLNGSTILCSDKHAFYNFIDGDSYGGYNGNGNIMIFNGTIIGGCISFIHGDHIVLKNLQFKDTLNDHFIEICACKDYLVEGCSFSGMRNLTGSILEYINIDTNANYASFPHNKSGKDDSVFYDFTTNKSIVVRNCYFSLGEGEYGYGFNAVGAHSRYTNATYTNGVCIENNIIRGFTGCGIRVNGMEDAYVANNNIKVAGDGIRVGDVADSKDVAIVNNYIASENGQQIALTSGRYSDITISGNIAKGDNELA